MKKQWWDNTAAVEEYSRSEDARFYLQTLRKEAFVTTFDVAFERKLSLISKRYLLHKTIITNSYLESVIDTLYADNPLVVVTPRPDINAFIDLMCKLDSEKVNDAIADAVKNDKYDTETLLRYTTSLFELSDLFTGMLNSIKEVDQS